MVSSFTVTAHQKETPAEGVASPTVSTISEPPTALPQLKKQHQQLQRPATAAPAPEAQVVSPQKDFRQSLSGGGRLLRAKTASRSVWDWTRGGVKVI